MLSTLSLLLLGACSQEQPDTATPASEPGFIALDGPAAYGPIGSETATGHAIGFSEVYLDHDPIVVDADGGFAVPVTLERGLNVLEALGVEADGDSDFARRAVLAGEFVDPDDPVSRAVKIRVNPPGIDIMARAAEEALAGGVIQDAIAGANPVYKDAYGIAGADVVTIEAHVEKTSFSTPEVALSPADDGLHASIELRDLHVTVVAYGAIVGVDFQSTVDVTANQVDVDGTLQIEEDGKGGLDVTLSDTSVDFTGFYADTSLVPGQVKIDALTDAVRSALEKQLETTIAETVPGLIDSQLSQLGDLSIDIAGLSLAVSAGFADADIDQQGISLAVDLGASLDGPDPGVGALTTARALPTLGTDAHVTAAVYDDIVNVALYQLWRGGLLNQTLSTADGSLQPALLSQLGAEEGTITVEGGMPPVMVEMPDGSTQLQVGELVIDLETPGGKLGDSMRVAAHVTAEVDLEIRSRHVTLALGELAVDLDVRSADTQARDVTVTRLLEEMIPFETLLAAVGGISVEVPELLGITAFHGEIERDEAGSHTGLSLYLKD